MSVQKEFARRACWALLQDVNVRIDMVDDLEVLIGKAVEIACRTTTDDEAVDMGIEFCEELEIK